MRLTLLLYLWRVCLYRLQWIILLSLEINCAHIREKKVGIGNICHIISVVIYRLSEIEINSDECRTLQLN